jgi:hypothetical protein
MADQKISELTAATSAASADLFNIVQGGTNKKLTVADFLANLNSPITINSAGSSSNDFKVKGSGAGDTNALFVDVSANSVGVGTATPSQKLDVAGNAVISAGWLGFTATPESVTGSGGSLTANLTNAITLLDSTNGNMTGVALANGTEGQVKTIIHSAGSGSISVIPNNRGGYASITMDTIGASVTLIYLGAKWWIVDAVRVTINGAS